MAGIKKGSFLTGGIMFVSFLGVLLLIFSPVFHGRNGLDYADDLFNKLTKGSSYFIPKLLTSTEKFMGRPFRVTLDLEKPQEAEQTAKLLALAGAKAEPQGKVLAVEGDLGQILQVVLRDSDYMFKNDGARVMALYGYDGKEVLLRWWTALTKMDRYFTKKLQVQEAKMVSEVIKKGVEPAYNFYQIESQRVADRAGIMTFLLLFYILYTLWWGYAIFNLFEGIGLSMKKAKIKREK
jgi:hypothetical protein